MQPTMYKPIVLDLFKVNGISATCLAVINYSGTREVITIVVGIATAIYTVLKVIQMFRKMGGDYCQHAKTCADREWRKE